MRGGLAALWFLLAAFVSVVLAPAAITPAEASDPLRLREDFQVLELHPYLSDRQDDRAIFSIQNGASTETDLLITRAAPLDLFAAFMPQGQNGAALRLFSSDDREFAAKPGLAGELAFSVPAGAVQSFYLLGVGQAPVLYLWSPEGRAAFEARRQTFHATLLLFLSIGFVLAVTVGIYRRSRRAVYAVIMGGGLMVLLASLWMRDVLPDEGMFVDWQANRLTIIGFSFAIGVAMSVLAHVNLVIKQIMHRNYWTRVIIVTDIWLVASIGLWTWQVIDPGYAGLLSAELGHIFMTLTCASVLLGAVFVPDRQQRS